MGRIGVLSQKEAIAMRIITVVTLLYLPATFVSVSTLLLSDISRLTGSDLLQHRCREVSESRGQRQQYCRCRKLWTFYFVLADCSRKMAADYLAVDLCDSGRESMGLPKGY
jgi:hypothetical protein